MPGNSQHAATSTQQHIPRFYDCLKACAALLHLYARLTPAPQLLLSPDHEASQDHFFVAPLNALVTVHHLPGNFCPRVKPSSKGALRTCFKAEEHVPGTREMRGRQLQ